MKNKILEILYVLEYFIRKISARFNLWRMHGKLCSHCCLWCKRFDDCSYELSAKVIIFDEFYENLRR